MVGFGRISTSGRSELWEDVVRRFEGCFEGDVSRGRFGGTFRGGVSGEWFGGRREVPERVRGLNKFVQGSKTM